MPSKRTSKRSSKRYTKRSTKRSTKRFTKRSTKRFTKRKAKSSNKRKTKGGFPIDRKKLVESPLNLGEKSASRPSTYELSGNWLKCGHCQHQVFIRRKTRIKTSFMGSKKRALNPLSVRNSIFDKAFYLFECTNCRHIEMFTVGDGSYLPKFSNTNVYSEGQQYANTESTEILGPKNVT